MRLPLFDQLPLFRPPSSRAPKPQEETRYVQFGSRIVEYRLRQAPRRRLTLNIDERGLRVNAPCAISMTEIEAFIHRNADWVLAKLEAYAHGAARRLVIRDGERVPLLGAEVAIRIVAGANRSRWHQDGTLVLEARDGACLDVLVRRALQRRAHEVFSQRIAHYAPAIAHPIPPLALSSARTRWGSCSRSGIRLNWRLIHLPLELIDYVVAHELAHLEQMNHSPRFWVVVERLYPDYKAARATLRQSTSLLPAI